MTPPADIVQVAIDASLRSTCRSKRGAVAFLPAGSTAGVSAPRSRDEVISFGWNCKPGPVAGGVVACDGSLECRSTCKRDAIHAEQMIVLSTANLSGCDILHVKTVDGQVAPAVGPKCLECSKLLYAAGVAGVWLLLVDGWRRYPIQEFHQLTLVAVYGDRYRSACNQCGGPDGQHEDSCPMAGRCMDCGMRREDIPADVVMSREQWLTIHPKEVGILCAGCIVRRAARIRGAVRCHLVVEIAEHPIPTGPVLVGDKGPEVFERTTGGGLFGSKRYEIGKGDGHVGPGHEDGRTT